MKGYANPPKRHREISFSESFQYQNNYQKGRYQSPKIAVEQKIQCLSKSKDYHRYESPLRNLHYKYLPNSKKVAQLESESIRQMELLQKREDSANKMQNFSEINKRIKRLLVDIEEQESRKEQFGEKASIQIPADSPCPMPTVYPTNKVKRDEQYCNKAQLNFIKQSSKMKSRRQEQKQNQNTHYFTPNKINKNLTPNRLNNVSSFEVKDSFKSPLTQKRMNQNSCLDRKQTQLQKSNYSDLKSSVYANLTQKRAKSSKQNKVVIIKGKNVQEQWQKLQNKIQELQKIKRQLQIQVPNKRVEEQSKIIESHLTQNSSINTFKAKQSQMIESQNGFLEQSHLISSKSRNEYKCESKFQKETSMESQVTQKNHQEKVIMEDVQLPKILRKITEKKNKAASQHNHNICADNHPKPSENTNHLNYSNQMLRDFTQELSYGEDKKMKKSDDEMLRDYEQMRVKGTNEKNNLLNGLKFQIKLDQQLRKVKKWFHKLKISNKFHMLQKQCEKNDIPISQYELKANFGLNPDEQNPFYNPQQGDFTVDELVKNFLAADRHWKYEVFQSYSRRNLLFSNFNEENIDISSKGYINIEDLTRYLNCQLDTFYRNRDVYLIYHRLKTSQKLYYSSILSCLSKQ